MFSKRLAGLIKSAQLQCDGKEKTLKLDWMENTKHSKDKTNNKQRRRISVIHTNKRAAGKHGGYNPRSCLPS